MVSTKSKTGAPKNVPRSKKASTKVLSLPSTSGEIDLNEPKNKRRRTAKEESNLVTVDKPPRRPEDGTLEALPTEIVLEIFSYLHPLDLLQLARTSRIFRDMLMSKSSRQIWRAARSALETDVPECPPDQSEPQWARLIFDLTCQTCNTMNATTVKWALRVRGCQACFRETLISGWEVHKAFPETRDVTYILDLLPFVYKRMYYRPAIQGMIDLYRSLKKEVSAKVPGAKVRFNTFVAEGKQNAIAILDAEGSLRSWEVAQAQLRSQKIQEEVWRWHTLYRDELIALGHHELDASRASVETFDLIRLEDGWEKNRAFLEEAASRMKARRIARERSRRCFILYRNFVAQPDKEAPVFGLWPSFIDLREADPQIKQIIDSSDEEYYQEEFKNALPTALDRWWESRKDILVEKIFDFKRQQSPAGEPEDGRLGPNQNTPSDEDLLPSFNHTYVGTSGPTGQGILELAKSVFTCPCQPVGWLKNYPVYWDRSLTNHECPQIGTPGPSGNGMDFHKIEFDALSSSQVDAICAALGLEPSRARFAELDALDARFRCVDCPFKRKIMNWRAAIRHRHNKGKISQRFLPTFAKISDEEAAVVRAFELDHPDKSCPVGRIRSPLCDKAFQTTSKLLDYLKNNYNQNELAPNSYWIDPSVPPMPVLESDAFEE